MRKYDGNRNVKHFTCWNQLLAMMFGQLSNRESLRDLIIALEAHQGKRYHLGLGREPIAKTTLASTNQNRDYNIENEKRGYKEGADAYISKPFHWDILLFRIQHLIEQKQQRQQTFKNEIEVNPSNITISVFDERLLSKALELIERNMSNSEYSIGDLSQDMAMSRATLYRKISSITGNAPSDFVKVSDLRKLQNFSKKENLQLQKLHIKWGSALRDISLNH